MNVKKSGLFVLTFFALVFVMSFTSAAINFVNSSSATQTIDNTNSVVATVSFALQENGAGDFTNLVFNAPITLNSGANSIVSSTSVSNVVGTLAKGTTSDMMSLTFSIPSTQATGTYSGTLTLTGKYNSTASYSLPITVTVTSSAPPEILNCNAIGNNGSLRINAIDFTNNGLPDTNVTFGDNNKWFPFENISAKVDVKNSGSVDVNSIEVDWGIWDNQKDQWIITPSELKTIDLGNGKTKSLNQQFQINNNMDVDLSDLGNGNHYQFYVIATGQVNNANSVETCAFRAENAQIAIESDFVAFTSLNIPNPVQCGQNVQVTGELWNVGDNDQNSVSVDVIGSNSSLQLSRNVPVGDINAFDNTPFSFSFQVPQSVTSDTYSVKFNVLDENGDIFQESLNDHYSQYLVPFTVSGGCTPQVSVIASTLSGGQTGKPLQVKATITNTGSISKTYNVGESGYSAWASSASSDQSVVTIGAGQSADVVFTFNVNDNAAGSQTFAINLVSGSDTVTQPVSVSIEQAPGFLGITGNTVSGTTLVWGLGILILILVVVVIIVAIRASRRK